MSIHSNSHSAIESLVDQIISSYKLTRADQQMLMDALLSKQSLNATEQSLINQVFDGIKRGLVRVID
uniref:Uncharacterized protein n=1 Tax=Desertifilum tharense IPPAS B-1220 TaxID=1781255 RepID=A0A1E5QPZ9_9CYAN|nr:hypothetical protein BH720_02985 [Desertifilum tharense IPPAS B-1220]